MRKVFKAKIKIKVLWLLLFFFDKIERFGKPLFLEPYSRGFFENVRKFALKAGQTPTAKFGKVAKWYIIVKII